MTVDIVNPLDIPDWDEQVLRLPGCSFFHSTAWARVLSESYGYNPRYFVFSNQGETTCIVPMMDVKSMLTGHRGVSLPFTDFCEPLVRDGFQFQEALKQMTNYGKEHGWKYIQLRGGQVFLKDAQASGTYIGHTLNLSPDESKVFSVLKDSTRRNVKKAIREGVEIRMLTSLDAMNDFCRLNCITRKEHGLPPQPYHFFQKLQHALSKGLGFICLGYYQGKAIAGNVYFHFGDKAVYKYGASDKAYQDLRASNLVMWEAIRWYCGKRFTELHMGRTEHDHHGLRQFKLGWAAEEYAINYFKFDIGERDFVTDGTNVASRHTALFRRAPIPLLRLMGKALYRHMA